VARDPARRAALASALVVVLFGAAISTTLWRYDEAVSQDRAALTARSDSLQSSQAEASFWRERESMNEYFLVPSQELLDEVTTENGEFSSETAGLGSDVASESSLVDQARSANSAFVAAFESARANFSGSHAQVLAALQTLDAHETDTTGPLDALTAHYTSEVSTSSAAAARARNEALLVGIIAGLLSLIAAALLGAFSALSMRGMIRRLSGTAAVLSEVATEMRAATRETATRCWPGWVRRRRCCRRWRWRCGRRRVRRRRR
jgi:hypothetical protein